MGLLCFSKKVHFWTKTMMPRHFRWKKSHFCPTRAIFHQNCWGIMVFGLNCTFVQISCSPIAELQSRHGIFEKVHFLTKTMMLCHFCWKKSHFCTSQAVFNQNCWGIMVFGLNCTFVQVSRIPMAELQSYCRIVEIWLLPWARTSQNHMKYRKKTIFVNVSVLLSYVVHITIINEKYVILDIINEI